MWFIFKSSDLLSGTRVLFLLWLHFSTCSTSAVNQTKLEPDAVPYQVETTEPSVTELITEVVTTLPTLGTTPKPPKSTTTKPTTRYPCKCGKGKCDCCTGALLNSLSIPIRQKLCLQVQYVPEDFEFQYKFLFNDYKLYQSKVSGKNPRPICLPLSRFLPLRACVQLSNVYMIGRNLHACASINGQFVETELFEVAFECFRIGTSGVALLKPEEGGGLPEKPIDSESQSNEDYDDSARNAAKYVDAVPLPP